MKKTISLLLSILMLLSITAGMSFSAEAATYAKIPNLHVPRFIQNYSKSTGGDGSCWLASFASIDCYRRGNTYQGKNYSYGSDYGHSDELYKYLKSKNNGSVGWPGAGAALYKDEKISIYYSYSLSSIYNALKAGKPVVIYSYGAPHASVVIGYKNASSALSTDNFVVMDVSQGYSQDKCYVSLSTWIKRCGTPSVMWYQDKAPKKTTNLSLSTTSVSLNLQGTNTAKVTATVSGDLPSRYSLMYDTSNSNVSASWGDWSGSSLPLTIKGLKVGSTTIKISLMDEDANKALKTATLTVSVTAPRYTVSFNANGGTNAPSSMSYYYGDTITIPSQTPKSNVSYTVNYELNGGTATDLPMTYTKEFDYWYDSDGNHYTPGSSYTLSSNKTLYAHYVNPKLTTITPTKENCRFFEWRDSNEVNDEGLPLGNTYIGGSSQINKNLTLYAYYTQDGEWIFGDINKDGYISLSDVTALYKIVKGTIKLNDIYSFIGDVNADGCLTSGDNSDSDTSDVNLLFRAYRESIDYYDLPAVKAGVDASVASTVKTTYEYGEEFDYDSAALDMQFRGTDVVHTVHTDVVVKGYDPYKVGTQTVTLAFYQYEAEAQVTVNAPKYQLNYDTQGGYTEDEAKEVTYDSAVGSLPTPEKQGYTFEGWYTSAEGGTRVTASTVYKTHGDSTIFAHWKKQKFTVSLNAINYSRAVEYGSEFVIPELEPTKNGYTFIGWMMDGNADELYSYGDTINVCDDVTFTPYWEETTNSCWVSTDGKRYYIKENGELAMGKQLIDGKTYIFSKTDGSMMTGKVRCDGKYYIMSKASGEMLYGMVRCDGKYYIMSKTTGEMLYGKVSCNGQGYIMSKSTGEMLYGKVTCNGYTYICSKSDGHIFKNMNVTCNGVKYYCNSSGVAKRV